MDGSAAKVAMICSEATLQRLEYPRLRTLLAGQTQSEPGFQLAEELVPLTDLTAVETALTETDEAVRCLLDGAAPSLGGCYDLSPLLTLVRAQGTLLAASDLLLVVESLRVMVACRSWFGGQNQKTLLVQLATTITVLPELQRRLREAIGSRGELLDSASTELGDLRYQVRQTRNRIKQRLEKLLTSDTSAKLFQERLITQRNNRYVVPLRSDCRGQLKGFVQDESSSGQTLYLEPAQVLEDNNQLQQLVREEQREERRVLLQLADLVRRDAAILAANQKVLARLDLRFASARLARGYQGCRPTLVSDSIIELRQVRHPLLIEQDGQFDLTKAVPVDILLGAGCQALLISGPNTGGKSVALKTLGLLLLMVRSGLHIPCAADSKFHLYRHLYVDIGDEQSIEQSLSTFSGHLLKVKEILASADGETLVLLDEAGTGTDPAEGAALVQAVLDQLCRQGAKTVLTTHLGQLKYFAQQHPAIENAAVEFDPDTLVPTYRLRYGIPGASSALVTAKRLGLPATVVANAIKYLGEKEYDHSALLVQLNRQQQQLEVELQQAQKGRLRADTAQRLRQQQLRTLKEKKRDILHRATQRGDELIAATEARLKQLRKGNVGISSPQESIAAKQQLARAREELQPFKPKSKRQGAVPVALQVGELVQIVALGIEAQVERIAGDKIDLTVGTKRMRQSLEALAQYRPPRFVVAESKRGQVTRGIVERQLSSQLKLVGQRHAEALINLERFIDDATLSNLQQVEIIHGSGAGILRRAVREYLAGVKMVTAFYAAPADQGGDNITIAELNTS